MKRYVRTKDGVYKVKKDFKPQVEDMICIPDEGLTRIIKQDNTIEDLVDEYVFVDSIGSFVITIDWCVEKHKVEKAIVEFECMSLSRPLKDCLKQGTIYGAIWTEWGLKYVAKMNDKGDLKLL